MNKKANMESQLEKVAKSYDRDIYNGKNGIDSFSYDNPPEHLKNDPNYHLFKKIRDEVGASSDRQEIKDYLSPQASMKFIDLGCCLNYMFKGLDKWPCKYYGVDISSQTIELLDQYAKRNGLINGSFYCGSIHDTRFDDDYFDIAACIGVLEYFKKDFVKEAIEETSRIIKQNGKFVLDIPDIGSKEFDIASKFEEYLGRPDLFNMTSEEFEEMISQYFVIDHKQKVGSMVFYYLRKK